MADADQVIVVGAGICGLSVARALVRRGSPYSAREGARAAGGRRRDHDLVQRCCRTGPSRRRGRGGGRRRNNGDPVDAELEGPNAVRNPDRRATPGERAPAADRHPPPRTRDFLSSSLADAVVRFGLACTGFAQDPDGVTVRLGDGTTDRAAALIVADGIDSGLRASLVPGVQPQLRGLPVPPGGHRLRGCLAFRPGSSSSPSAVGTASGSTAVAAGPTGSA